VGAAVSSRRSVYLWGAASVAAIAYVIVMFVAGSPPTHRNRVVSEVAGLLTSEPARIVHIEIITGDHEHTFERGPDGWHAQDAHDDEPVDGLIETALGLLHRSAPIRMLQPEQTADVPPAAYGLAPPSLEIRLAGTGRGNEFEAVFGDALNDGRARYLRLKGQAETWIVSGFIYDAWRAVMH
jgi:hypothetical protein